MEISSGTVSRQISRLHWTTIGVITATLLLIGFLVSQPIPLGLLGFVASLFFMQQIRRNAARHGLDGIATHEADEFTHARIFNVVEGLCVVSGDARPVIEIADTPFPLAAVVGSSGSATIVVSEAFCDAMDRVETEAVMAHLLWRVRSGDADLVAYLRSLSTSFARLGLLSVARLIVGRVAIPESLLWADIAACQATRYPPAVASALEKIDTSQTKIPDTSSVSQWFALPDSVDIATIRDPFVSIVGTSRPSIADRVGILKEM